MKQSELLKRFLKRAAGDTTAFDYFDLLHRDGSPFEALFYSRLFLPEFVEFDGMIFLQEEVESRADRGRIRKALVDANGDSAAVEASFNRTDIDLMFGRRLGDTDDEEDHELVRRIAESWRTRLATLFPNRSMIVALESPEESGGSFGLTFCTAGKD